jgi:HEAT repeat protein
MRIGKILTTVGAIGLAAVIATGCQDPVAMVASSNTDEVVAGIRLLAKRGTDEDIGLLTEVTANKDESIAREAARGIGTIQRPKAAEALTKVASTDPRGNVREEAVLQLGRQPEANPMEFLKKMVQSDPDPRVRTSAAASLERLGSRKDTKLLELLIDVAEKDGDPAVQVRAVRAVEALTQMSFLYNQSDTLPKKQAAIERMRNMFIQNVPAPTDTSRK